MATIGLKNLYMAEITEDQYGNEVYGTPQRLAKAISANMSVEYAEGELYADDALSESVKEFKKGTLTLGIDDLGTQMASKLTGAKVDRNGVLISSDADTPKPVAIGFQAKKSNGKTKFFWLLRVLFGVPNTELATKGDSITFNTPSIEGTILRRNKAENDGSHSWKAEATEGEVDATITDGWFDDVYEPDANVTLSEVPQVVIEGSDVILSVALMGDTFAWFEVNGDSMTRIDGETTDTATITGLSAGTHTFVCKVDGDYTQPVTVTVTGD